MAFLGGLAFCVLLIPVNRWLAVKIGKLSTAMMAQKDQRVKVCTYVRVRIYIHMYVSVACYPSEYYYQRSLSELRTYVATT